MLKNQTITNQKITLYFLIFYYSYAKTDTSIYPRGCLSEPLEIIKENYLSMPTSNLSANAFDSALK